MMIQAVKEEIRARYSKVINSFAHPSNTKCFFPSFYIPLDLYVKNTGQKIPDPVNINVRAEINEKPIVHNSKLHVHVPQSRS